MGNIKKGGRTTTFFFIQANCLRILDSSLGSGQTSYWYAERRARNVGHTGFVEELYRSGITTVLTANTALQVGTGATTTFHT
jgi:hypothetical protein